VSDGKSRGDRRPRRLAIRPSRTQMDDDTMDATADAAELKLAGFRVGDGLYGVDIMRIKEVIQSAPYTVRPVPHAPSIVEGVIALRGVVIPVVDLRKRFGAPLDAVDAKLHKLVIVSVRGRIVALKVDRILGELRVPMEAVRPAPSMLRPAAAGRSGSDDSDFFTGVCRVDDEMVFLVKLETLLDPTVGSRTPSEAVSSGTPEGS
jgi:purine-binding chemotaxis protein CheW